MNKHGHPDTLVAAHPENTNAVKYGAHSQRLIAPRASEIVAQLTESFEFSLVELIAVQEVARCIAIIEAIDRDLTERGVVDKRGNPRYLLNHRSRTSRQLQGWLSQIAPSVERQSAGEPAPSIGRPEYLRELQWIALGRDSSASARDRVSALKELLAAEEAIPPENKIVTMRIVHEADGTERVDSSDEADEGARDGETVSLQSGASSDCGDPD
jgi:hypothetical protein